MSVRPSVESKPLPLVMSAPRRGKPPRHFADLSAEERTAAVVELGEKPFRAKQLATHYYAHYTSAAEDMTDLPKASRDLLVENLFPQLLTPARVMQADGGTTVKTLWKLFDAAKVESVLMRYPNRSTLCVSSQAGCGMACPFCATGQLGLTRNLSTAEIVEQVRSAAKSLADGDIPGGPARLNNLVFMGMGEPMANYKAVMGTIRQLIAPAPEGLGMSARNITVSTVGLVPAMNKLSAEGIPVTLALSLHAPDDDLRSELVPINTRWSVDETLDAARNYFEVTGRRVSIEYALIKDMNDHAWRADLLGEKLTARGSGWVHVNPIPLNPTPGSIWTASERDVEDEFVARLRGHGIPTTIRDTRGSDIDGACGQLAAEEEE
ncbi:MULTISPECIES: 23S rRNA (adenine(2503)-C(2))-methyltransferase RlmN [Oerskovia]|jgi:23S rRNA (adenine2503-C2)-methyltransferase|uniref:Probable dual-specificity RNA methyltransferase RlmN n=3 Tax=Oerskovia TaxID=162491 RepID=A0A163SMB3_9CELL|nr:MULTISPECIES: 23S rRNA (adenine(2503)-C(2))-methyltransferase RlmN [Oerskovia]MBD7982493.1 23S rRNA (adenine(2503)-C(2))-methyltransferase RlmN [Oerskovia merdavium]KRC37387.1 23S rRNA (adenine(2503)-C2)-methyltransferase [Oerskovia sp. Root22]KRD40410.1 23S rRNA (adenine(2503)-C2)-methyltransferase [Oerskovia sp. Root918]KZM36579.1 putative dual-specificity RNA methyltransferase RlmN [Oerskovia enterophila]OCI31281.1 putative dual-specificity RNA methyltransferase RlmN [Oerskovia enterophi